MNVAGLTRIVDVTLFKQTRMTQVLGPGRANSVSPTASTHSLSPPSGAPGLGNTVAEHGDVARKCHSDTPQGSVAHHHTPTLNADN